MNFSKIKTNGLHKFSLSRPVLAALSAAILFGGSTPLAKVLVNQASPILLAGLLYLGSGIGLMLIRLIRDHGWKNPALSKKEWPWLLSAISFGGILGPILLMFGLTQASAANASLLLNLEAVLTAVIAWVVFKENTDHRIVLGMFFIVAGGVLLSWPHEQISVHGGIGSLAIAAACLCWAIDNNLTRKVSASDALFLSSSKGLIAGIVNISLAYELGMQMPTWTTTAAALLCGFLGYGVSLLLFIFALRGLGTARTGAYFSIAPFIGAAIAILFFQEEPSILFWIAFLLMSFGVGLHLTEKHEHEHVHEAIFHDHQHMHDEHHQHDHDFPCDVTKAHSHPHQHETLVHTHRHYPDLNHRHQHE